MFLLVCRSSGRWPARECLLWRLPACSQAAAAAEQGPVLQVAHAECPHTLVVYASLACMPT